MGRACSQDNRVDGLTLVVDVFVAAFFAGVWRKIAWNVGVLTNGFQRGHLSP